MHGSSLDVREENRGGVVGNVNKKDFMKGRETELLETSRINNRLKVYVCY